MDRAFLRAAGSAALIVAALAMVACTTTRAPSDGRRRSVTIPYNPYEYDPDELRRAAELHCAAYNQRAVFVDETVDPNSVRWRYRHYDCV